MPKHYSSVTYERQLFGLVLVKDDYLIISLYSIDSRRNRYTDIENQPEILVFNGYFNGLMVMHKYT